MEPQATQMPHMNTKDLAIFLEMSKRHMSISRSNGGLYVYKKEEIWYVAKDVREQFPSCKIARIYILAYYIGKKVAQHDEGNIFLDSSGGLHSGVKEDFDNTLWWGERKDDKHIPAPPIIQLIENRLFDRTEEL